MIRLGRLLVSLSALLAFVPAASAQIPPSAIFPPFDAAACVQKPQHVLIFDMKSGWWSGDGGEFHAVLLERLVKDCPNIDVEYYYLQFIGEIPLPGVGSSGIAGFQSFFPVRPEAPNGGLFNESAYPSRPWTDYTQIWLLSGANHDPTDVPTTSEFFTKMLGGLSQLPATPGQAPPSLFIAAGLGHHDHANRVMATFQLPELFQSHATELLVPTVGAGEAEVLSRLTVGAALQPHALFEGAPSIADRVRVGGMDVDSDFMTAANNPFQVIGTNTQGEPSIAVLETVTPPRRWVIDTGVSRFYSLWLLTETETYRYLQNLVKFLGR